MQRTLIAPLRFYQACLHELIDASPAERLAEQVGGVKNHPLWTVGHLAVSNLWCLSQVETIEPWPESWEKTMGYGSEVVADASAYPALAELWAAYDDSCDRLVAAIEALPAGRLEAVSPYEPMLKEMPTLGALLGFVSGGHQAMHVGQVQAWRQAAGLGRLM